MSERSERNMATVQAFYAAGPASDDAERTPFAVDDIVWNVPGDNHVSGRYVGQTEVFETMPASMQPLDQWELDVVDLFANGDLVIATVNLRGRRGPLAIDCTGAHLFRLDEQSRIVEAWGFVDDQEGLDALLDS